MRVIKRSAQILLAAVILAVMFAGCKNAETEQAADIPPFASFRDIPGVTSEEIGMVSTLRDQNDRFIYGAIQSTETFYREDGGIGGFTALFCNWLTELFDIPFEPKIVQRSELIPGLESFSISFNGDLTITDERISNGYFMTDSIAVSNTGYDMYGEAETGSPLHLAYSMVSLTTLDPRLKPVISIVSKALDNGAPSFLNYLYNAGMEEYMRVRLYGMLTMEEKDYIRNRTIVPFAAEFDNYPYCFYNRYDRQWQGAVIDILDEVCKLTGLEFLIINGEQAQWEEILAMLESGEASIVSELIHTEDREGRFLWPDKPVLTDNFALISKQEAPYLNYFQIQHVRVGVSKGTAYSEIFEKWFPHHKHLVQYESTDIAFEALSAGDIDVVMTSVNRLLRLTNYDERLGYKVNVVFDQPFDSTLGLNINETVLCSILDKSLEMIDTSEIAGQWLRKTFDYRARLAQERLPWIVIAASLLLVLLFLLALYFRHRSARNHLELAVLNRTTELSEAQTDLRAAVEKAEAANNAKSSFLANMSHEMRTPLNAILGLSELSLESGSLSGEDRSNLTRIKSAGVTLLSIVSDILDISKIETGKLELILAQYDTPSMINDAVTQSILHIGEKPIKFILNIGKDLPVMLYGDELRTRQILTNLLSNAFKYTQRGEVELTIECIRDGDAVWMTASVKDTGIGINPEYISRLFDDYAQLDMSANRKIIGTGLGLPIAKRLAGLMDGNITVESEYGKGSVFTVRLRQEHVSDEAISREVVENLKNFNYSEQKHRQNANQPRISLPNARVLVVDDVPTNVDVAIGLMKRYNMQIDGLTSGPEAIELVRSENPRYNAIFMDHMMPGMDGVEATRLIREIDTEYARSVPIIAFTANAIVGNEEMFLEKGFQAFISKPIELARLDAVIRQWVRVDQVDNDVSGAGNEGPSDSKQLLLCSTMEGIDLKKGLERFGGDEEAYIGVLRSFARNTPPLLEKALTVDKSQLADYITVVHGIKGSSAGIYAEETAKMAEALESAAKSSDLDYINANNAILVEIAQKLLSELGRFLERLDAGAVRQKKDKPDSETLEILHAACTKHDMQSIDSAVAELDAYEYESGGELVAWLKENAEQMNYAEIAERLSGA